MSEQELLTLSIVLDRRESECAVCGVDLVSPRFGVPMLDGYVLPNTWTGIWGGFDACEDCYEAQQALVEPVWSDDLAALVRVRLAARVRREKRTG